MKAVNLYKLTASDTVFKLAKTLVPNGNRSWSHVLGLVNLFRQITLRMQNEWSDKSGGLQLSIQHLKSCVREYLAAWIHENGGWVNYQSPHECRLTMRPAIEYLLGEAEHFIVLFCDTTRNRKSRKAMEDIASYLRKHENKQSIFLCGEQTFSTQMEEVEFYKRYDNAVFVPLVTASDLQNREFLSCLEKMSSEVSLPSNIVIPVTIYGLNPNSLPTCLQKYRHLEAFHKSSWNLSETLGFVELLCSHYKNLLEEKMLLSLNRKTRDQLNIILKLDDQHGESDFDRIKLDTVSLLEDPWTSLRQELLHLYKTKNITVSSIPGKNHLLLELIPENPSDLQTLIADYRNGRLQLIFRNKLKEADVTQFLNCSVCIDEDKAKSFNESMVSTATVAGAAVTVGIKERTVNEITRIPPISFPFHGRDPKGGKKKVIASTRMPSLKRDPVKLEVVANVAKAMIKNDNGFYPYDLFSMLVDKADEMNLSDVKDENGHNLLHIIVKVAKAEYLQTIFYLNLWDDLRLQLTDPDKDPQYGGYTPRGLAEKLLYKEHGPDVLEQYDYYDRLWLAMPPLHRASLRGSVEYVQLLVSKRQHVNETDNSGATCILYACASGSADVVGYLLDNKADPKLANDRGENSLILAAKYGKADVVGMLLSKCDFDQSDCDELNYRAVDYAAMNGDFSTLKTFTENNIIPDERMVSMASKNNRHQLVKHLIAEYNLHGTGLDEDGRSPFLNAAANGNIKTLKLLMEKPVVIKARDHQNRNCLHLVAEFNQPVACRYLIEAAEEEHCLKELIDGRDFYCGRDQLKVVRGRDKGRGAWHYVSISRTSRHGFEEKLKSGQIELRHFGEIRDSGFGLKPSKDLVRKYDQLAEGRIKQALKDMTPLVTAVFRGHKDVAMMLLAAGSDTNITDYFGSTPLHMAAMMGDLELVRELVGKGVRLSVENDEHKTAKRVADDNDHRAVVNFLEGDEFFKYAELFSERVKEAKSKLSDEALDKMRAEGVDVRRYVIDLARGLKIDVNMTLLELGSGPVLEESCNTRGLSPRDFKCEFAGNKIECSFLRR